MDKPHSLRILLLSAYDAASHRHWRSMLQEMMPEHEWTVLPLPARHFSWRIRGNALSYAFSQRPLLESDYDLVLATSMVDLSTLRGFVPTLARVPTILYFHENQFAYPEREQQRDNAEIQIVPLYSALCADRIVFNSTFNRRTFLAGAAALLERLPDHVPKGLLERLEASEVLPVPLAAPSAAASNSLERGASPVLEVVWNHRWEYDKGPSLLLEAVRLLVAMKLPLRLHLAGQQFRDRPAEFDEVLELLAAHCDGLGIATGVSGYLESPADYAALISRCDVVLSTASHDFQGLALQEGALRGCAPLAPADLVYPEYLPATNLYTREHDDASTALGLVAKLEEWQREKAAGRALPLVDLQHLADHTLATAYRRLFEETRSRTQY